MFCMDLVQYNKYQVIGLNNDSLVKASVATMLIKHLPILWVSIGL